MKKLNLKQSNKKLIELIEDVFFVFGLMLLNGVCVVGLYILFSLYYTNEYIIMFYSGFISIFIILFFSLFLNKKVTLNKGV